MNSLISERGSISLRQIPSISASKCLSNASVVRWPRRPPALLLWRVMSTRVVQVISDLDDVFHLMLWGRPGSLPRKRVPNAEWG